MSDAEKITPEDLLERLAKADALQAFLALPVKDQQEFARWVGKARNDESHWHRIDALVAAISLGPLQPTEWVSEDEHQGFA